MTYQFECRNEKCSNHSNIIGINMKMSEYTDNHFCSTCGDKLERTIESMVCGYLDNKDFYGKKSK